MAALAGAIGGDITAVAARPRNAVLSVSRTQGKKPGLFRPRRGPSAPGADPVRRHRRDRRLGWRRHLSGAQGHRPGDALRGDKEDEVDGLDLSQRGEALQ